MFKCRLGAGFAEMATVGAWSFGSESIDAIFTNRPFQKGMSNILEQPSPSPWFYEGESNVFDAGRQFVRITRRLCGNARKWNRRLLNRLCPQRMGRLRCGNHGAGTAKTAKQQENHIAC